MPQEFMPDVKKRWFDRAKAIVVAFTLAAVFFLGFLTLKQVLQSGLLSYATGVVPNYDNVLYHDIAASVALLIIVLIFRCSRRVGLNWPDSRHGWGALVVLVCYTAAIHLNGGIFFAHLTFHLVSFEVLTEALTGFWEELCFRGFVMAILRPCGVLGSLLISSALFGLGHETSRNQTCVRDDSATSDVFEPLVYSTTGLVYKLSRWDRGSACYGRKPSSDLGALPRYR